VICVAIVVFFTSGVWVDGQNGDDITRLSKIPGHLGLEKAVQSYAEVYLKNHTLDEFKEYIFGFHHPKVVAAHFRVVIADAYRIKLDSGIYADDKEKAEYAEAVFKVLFEELSRDFALEDLSNYLLVRIGDYISEKKNEPRAARVYYEEVLKRPAGQPYRSAALGGLEKISGKGIQPKKIVEE